MVAPSGDQFEFAAEGYRAVVTECGATLRVLEYAGRPLLHGFGEDEMSPAGRGQLLMPWPNRIRDGAYSFDGQDLQPRPHRAGSAHAMHGLARWAAWTARGAQRDVGHPELPADGADRLPVDARPARPLRPLGRGSDRDPDRDQPQRPARAVRVGSPPLPERRPGPVDGWELTLPASLRLLADERQIPMGDEDVDRHAVRLPGGATAARPPARRRRSATSSATPTGVAPPWSATPRPASESRCGLTGTTRG